MVLCFRLIGEKGKFEVYNMFYCSGVLSAWASFPLVCVCGLSRVGKSVSYLLCLFAKYSLVQYCACVLWLAAPLYLSCAPLSVFVTFVVLNFYCGVLVIMRSVLSPRWDVPVFLYYLF